VITAEELARSEGSLRQVLERLRPWMLGSRGTPTFVTVDGSPLTDLSILAVIPVSTVQEVRLRRAFSSAGHTAVSPSGAVVAGDIIEVTTRSRVVPR
jgi:hypothetical protein